MTKHYVTSKQASDKTDQIATMRIIIEQSMEWNYPLQVNFVDYEAFDSVTCEVQMTRISKARGAFIQLRIICNA